MRRLCCSSESEPRKFLIRLSDKIDKAQRHPYWKFDVRRSMLDIQSFHGLGLANSRTRVIVF